MRSVRTRVAAGGVVAALTTLLLAVPVATADAATTSATTLTTTVLAAPTGVTATRSTDNPRSFTVRWQAVPGAVDHYNVSVTAAGRDTVTIVPGDQTSLQVTGLDDPTTNYRITVSSRDALGEGSTSNGVWLYSLSPWVARNLTLTRSTDLTSFSASWSAPSWPGYGGTTGYDVRLVRISDGAVIDAVQNAPGTTFSASGLDPKRLYRLSVWARNTYGTSLVVGASVPSDVPEVPTGVAVVRDANDPSIIHASWKAPTWIGAGPIRSYQVVYGANTLNKTLTLPATALTANVVVPYTISGLVTVRACNDNGCGYLAKYAKAGPKGVFVPVGPLTSTNPFVGIQPQGSYVHVETRGIVGSTWLYPRLYVEVRPTLGTTGFTDAQYAQNGAVTMSFGAVPNGTYTVIVHGVSATGVKTELARKVMVFGTATELTSTQWKVVRGKATISGTSVDMPYEGENRVMSTKARTSQDMVLTTNATLRFGWGYGVWFRGGVDTSNLVSGYTFQYDPKYGNAFIIRHWYQGNECSTPLAKTSFPSGFAINAAHKLVVVAKGDTVWASVDGVEMFRVNSLSAAVAASPCRYPMATGTGIGFRTWSTSSAVFTGTTLS